MADLQALGLIEHYPRVTEMGTDACVIRVNAGKTFGAGDLAIIEWGDSEENVSDNFLEPEVDLEGYVKGDVIVLPVDGLIDGEAFWYRIRITSESVPYDGEIIGPVVAGIVPAGETVRIGVLSASRHMHIVSADDARLSVFRQAVENLISDEPHIVVGCDNLWYCDGAGWPIDENGQHIDGSSFLFAQSQAQCEIANRLFERDLQELLRRRMYIECDGSATGMRNWFMSANNGGDNDLRSWALAAINAHFGNLANSDKHSGDSDGRYGAIDAGPVKICYYTTDPSTILRTSGPASTRKFPDSWDDYTWGQGEWDFFFDATTGVVTLADPDVTPFILFIGYGVTGGQDTLVGSRDNLGGVLNAVNKTFSRNSYEHGADPSWLNSYGYSGDYLALGIHGAIVARTQANGCRAIFAYNSKLSYAYEELDGVHYVCCGRAAGGANKPWEYRKNTEGGYGTIPGSPTNTNRSAVYRASGGHMLFRANADSFIGQYIRAYLPGLLKPNGTPVTAPEDGIAVNRAIVHQFTVTRQTKARAIIRAGGGTFVTDSTTPAAAGSTQPDRDPRDPPSVVGEFGTGWTAATQGTSPDDQLMTERASAIDGLIVISTTRPKTAAAAVKRQTIFRPLAGLSRLIRVKARMESTAPTNTIGIIGICTQPENYLTSSTGKGLTLRFAGTSAATNLCRLQWDNGSTDASQVISSPNYKCPVDSDFDAGFLIFMQARRVRVFAPVAGAMTKIIDHDIGATIWDAIRADATMRCVGMGSSISNVTGQGGTTEFIDFSARYLPK